MKYIILCLSLFLSVCSISAQSQQAKQPVADFIRCGTDALHQSKLAEPIYQMDYQNLLQMRQDVIDSDISGSMMSCPNGNVYVPVAFHYEAGMGTTAAEQTCLESLAIEQVDILNDAFNGLNALGCTTTNPNGACMTFVIATQSHPGGSGLNNGDYAITYDGAYTCGFASPCNMPAWGGYLNIAIQDMLSNNGPLGIAPLNGNPNVGGQANTMIVDKCGFGTDTWGCSSAGPTANCGGTWQYVSGNTTVHEAGHFFGLPHTFCSYSPGDPQGANDCSCSGSANCDGFTDTPDQCYANFSCFSGTCSSPVTSPCDGSQVIWNNFMDYLVDDCMNSFSDQQTSSMNSIASNDNFDLSTLVLSTPTCQIAVEYFGNSVVDGSTINVCDGGVFSLQDLTSDVPTNWNWTISATGGITASPSSSTAQNPLVTISGAAGSSGLITINLTATNGQGSCSPGATFTVNANMLSASDPLCQCNLSVVPDWANAVCADTDGDGLSDGISMDMIITGNSGSIVWIEQSNPPNTTYDVATDFNILSTSLVYPLTDIVVQIYDSGNSACALTLNIDGGNYTCNGISPGLPPDRLCTMQMSADMNNITCNGTTASVPLDITDEAGNVTFAPAGIVTGTGTAGDPYLANLNTGLGCGVVTITASDDGAGTSQSEFLEITAPLTIAGQISSSSTDGTWAQDIFTVSPPICADLVLVNDGTAPEADFCEPTPPATPTTAQCTGISGKIAVIDRGSCFFTDKVENAQACGAVAVLICNCQPGAANCNSTDPDEIITMSGTPQNPITIPVVMASYNDCQTIQLEMLSNTVSACIGAPIITADCDVDISINSCSINCAPPTYCDNPCYQEYDPNPGSGSTASSSDCITALACADNPSSSCLTTQTCDDGDPCTNGEMETIISATGEVCTTCGGGNTIVINPLILGLPPVTSSITPISLSAIPAGGVFTGPGIFGSSFNPGITGTGIKTITYTYTDSAGCSFSTSADIFVISVSYNFSVYQLGTISP